PSCSCPTKRPTRRGSRTCRVESPISPRSASSPATSPRQTCRKFSMRSSSITGRASGKGADAMAMFRTYVECPEVEVMSSTSTLTRSAPVPSRAVWAVEEYTFKRVIDVTLASAALIVAAPLWVLIALAIKLEDRGPVFFTQARWGRNRRAFQVYKFRSMVVDADSRVQAGRGDDRITRVGGLLRKTSLDELPQLI